MVFVELPDLIGERHDLTCDVCGRVCMGKNGKLSHMRSHFTSAPTNYNTTLSIENSCHFYGKVCKPAGEPKKHGNCHKNRRNGNKMYIFHVCDISFKVLSDLKSHIHSKQKLSISISCNDI